MEHLDAIVAVDLAGRWAVGRKEVRSDEFWVPGHIPGRPLLPGVVMIEAAAQLCSFLMKKIRPELRDRFIGFAGVEGARFRATVEPGARLILVSKLRRLGRLGEFDTQGIVDGRVVFKGRILGIPV
ncbi:MAG: beta-hydroxyacyl-ACP dehydratase [Planctomycetes bacterium]|nr:beta-hydroxyacyl-ACP dehydratase [Planctomycetota bacterium]